MKKLLTLSLCALMAVASIVFVACNSEPETQKVNLVAIDATQIGVADVDYYVVPEPAASTKVGAMSAVGLQFSGDLQALYGGTNGYPQAVIVAKNSLLEYGFMTKFVEGVISNKTWLTSTSAETVVNAVSAHLTEGMNATFNAKNLTSTVINNCGINFRSASAAKTDILSFMDSLNSVAPTSFGTPADKFFHDGQYGSEIYDGTVKVYAPDGAPALGLAKLLADECELDSAVEYSVVKADTIQTYVTGANPVADICVLPVNLAVKLLGSGEKYSLVGTLTNGNLYMLSKGAENITQSNISTLAGKTVGVVNLAQVPGLTFKLILKNNGLEYTELV